MLPAEGLEAPDNMFTIVLLPAPFGPISARTPPCGMPKLTASTAFNPPNERDKPVTDRMSGKAVAIPGAQRLDRADHAAGEQDEHEDDADAEHRQIRLPQEA